MGRDNFPTLRKPLPHLALPALPLCSLHNPAKLYRHCRGVLVKGDDL
jgi:hypothetical protein